MKKKAAILILVIVALCVCSIGFVWLNSDSDYPVEVAGRLTTNEVKQIKRLVRSGLSREILPNISWASIKGLPQAYKIYSKTKVLRIERFDFSPSSQPMETGGFICVVVGKRGSTITNPGLDDTRFLKLGSNGWEWIGKLSLNPN
jgi:hypothetical protein